MIILWGKWKLLFHRINIPVWHWCVYFDDIIRKLIPAGFEFHIKIKKSIRY
jgi:hypothetical protein